MSAARHPTLSVVDPISLTRELVEIESITGNEARVGDFLHERLSSLGYEVRRMHVEGDRFNILALPPNLPKPRVVLSTHMDTVPPYIPCSADNERIYGRGACDAKGIIAAQVGASERLRAQGLGVGLLFLVGEELDNAGARVANQQPLGSAYLINGEPTENRLALASKGALHVKVSARGRAAHSGYPELGESAVEKLIEALRRLRSIELPVDPDVGPTTMNIGVIEGGRAPNVVPDCANARLLFRLVGPSSGLRKQIKTAVGNLADVEFGHEVPFMRLPRVGTLPTMVAAFYTDIPALDRWGKPLLIGPGSIHSAHTAQECIEKSELMAAVGVYEGLAEHLLGNDLEGW